jgi:hypothetical protein
MLMPGATSLDLFKHKLAPVRLDARQLSDRRALYFRDSLANLAEYALFLIFRQRRPRLLAENAVHARDDKIRPSVALAFE